MLTFTVVLTYKENHDSGSTCTANHVGVKIFDRKTGFGVKIAHILIF